MQTVFASITLGAGWFAGYFIGGGHEWGWRGAVVGLLLMIAVAVRVNNEPTGQ
jgi:hypothetical protein